MANKLNADRVEAAKKKAAEKKLKADAKAKENKEKAEAKIAAKKIADDKKKAEADAKKSKTIDHVVTQLDLDNDPSLAESGVKLGDTIQIPLVGKYHVSISVNDSTSEVDTDNIKEYILSLGLRYIKTKTIIRVSVGKGKAKKTVEKVLMTAFAKRLFGNDMTALVFEKNIKLALGEPSQN